MLTAVQAFLILPLAPEKTKAIPVHYGHLTACARVPTDDRASARQNSDDPTPLQFAPHRTKGPLAHRRAAPDRPRMAVTDRRLKS